SKFLTPSLSINGTLSRQFNVDVTGSHSRKVFTEKTEKTDPFIDSFQRHLQLNILQQMPSCIKALASLCQILDDCSLSAMKMDQIRTISIDSILWRDDKGTLSKPIPIALDQNKQLNNNRPLVRELTKEFLEISQQILAIYKPTGLNDAIDDQQTYVYRETQSMIQTCYGLLELLNDYRGKRQDAFKFLCRNPQLEDTSLALASVDEYQFHILRLIAIYLRQFYLKLLTMITTSIEQRQTEMKQEDCVLS
ncbi:unnamed protein product, partial [Didymodactylos carnosus]